MINSKAVETIKDLRELGGKEAVSRYKKFLISQKKVHLAVFVDHVNRNFDNEPLLRREQVYKKVFNGNTFDKRKLDNLAYQSVKTATNFIMMDTLFKKSYFQQRIKATYFKLKKKKEAYLETVNDILENYRPPREAEWHLVKADFLQDIYFNFYRDDYTDAEFRNFLVVSRFHYRVHATIKELMYFCEEISRMHGRKGESWENLSADFDHLRSGLPKNVMRVPVVDLMCRAIELARKPCMENYLVFRKGFFLHFEELMDDRKFLIRTLLNGIHLFDFPAQEKQRELFTLNDFAWKHDLFIVNAHMDVLIFSNVIYTAISVKEFDWAKRFLDDSEKHVPKDTFERVSMVVECRTLMHHGKYEEANALIAPFKTKDFAFMARKFIIQMMCIYESRQQEAYDDIRDIARKFWRFFNRRPEKNMDRVQFVVKRVKNAEKIVKILAQPRFTRKKSLAELKTEISSLNTAHSVWLFEKIEELERSGK